MFNDVDRALSERVAEYLADDPLWSTSLFELAVHGGIHEFALDAYDVLLAEGSDFIAEGDRGRWCDHGMFLTIDWNLVHGAIVRGGSRV